MLCSEQSLKQMVITVILIEINFVLAIYKDASQPWSWILKTMFIINYLICQSIHNFLEMKQKEKIIKSH